jgi:hypothetical protein
MHAVYEIIAENIISIIARKNMNAVKKRIETCLEHFTI